jgi:hypothetical protein
MFGLEIPFLLTAVALLARAWRLSEIDRLPLAATSSLASIIYLLCLWLPAHLQSNGLIVSKIDTAGILFPPSEVDIAYLSLNWCLELIAILIAEILAGYLFVRKRAHAPLRQNAFCDRSILIITCIVLLLIGGIATIVFPATDLADRAAEGQGVANILRSSMVAGLAVMAFCRFFDDRRFMGVAFICVCFLVLKNIRSPLLLVFLGYIAGMIARGELRGNRLVILMFAGVLLAGVGSYMSNMRANIARGFGMTSTEVLAETLENPWIAPYSAGIDTLDGYRLSQYIAPFERPDYLNIMTVFTTFVPRAIWPSKPEDLSVSISSRWLHYKGSGQFLSPIGYLTIAYGGYIFGVAVFFILFGIGQFLYLRSIPGPLSSFIFTIEFRFLLGGSPFDIYYGLTFILQFIVVYVISKFVFGEKKRKDDSADLQVRRSFRI